ncbi:LPS assembly protein LptD [Marinomonas sp. 15G1-11]|uniref:LPS-assembly protein LptD n=1 Tax=Marinomonas phaeophyticola TaxID=3004091 RepID=A0ABT4JS22_9GAMM|nr:LPS assembly protein LptD [Marinomonas sp. 15G1-11]MCZ2721164.1 LPS assembly protein LptD [Marinomonas sp. 15G1-11]
MGYLPQTISIPRIGRFFPAYTLIFHGLFIIPQVNAAEWDWLPSEALTQEQRSTVSQYCRGRYIDAWQASENGNTNLSADLIYKTPDGTLFLEGGAELIQPQQSLKAENIQGRQGEYYQAEGEVELRSKGQLIRSQKTFLADPESNLVTRFEDARFLRHKTGARGQAKSLQKDAKGIIFIEEGFYTTCEPGNGSWKLYGSSIVLDPNSGFGTAKHVQIKVDDYSIFYLPWLRFPLDNERHTGFLFPDFSYSNDKGIGFSAPFYWNLAPAYDATITPHFIENEGEGLDIELRHLSKRGLTQFEETDFFHQTDGRQTARRLISTQTINTQLTAGLTFEQVDADNDFPTQTNINLTDKDHYERQAYLNFNQGNLNATASVKTYQTPLDTVDQPFEWRPRLDASYRFSNTLLDYKPSAQYTDFYDPDESEVDGQRRVLNQDIALNFQNAWGSLSPGILQQYRSYDLHNYNDNSHSTDTINHISHYIDAKMAFDRRFTVNAQTWKQTLEPKLSYLNSPYKNQDDFPNFDTSEPILLYDNAFSHKRFSGNDRVGDTEQFTIGLESYIYDSNNQERWGFKLGQILYLEDRVIDVDGTSTSEIDTNSTSSLLSAISYKDSDHLNITANVNYDQNIDLLDLGQLSIKLRSDNGIVVKSSYLKTVDKKTLETDLEQLDFQSIVPLNDNWHFLYQQTYDWIEQEDTKKVAGFGFENCCLKLSFSYQRSRDDDNQFDEGIFLQFILRSLSGVGSTNSTDSIATEYWNDGKTGY